MAETTAPTTIIVSDTAKRLMAWKRELEAMAKVGRDATEAERRMSRLTYQVLRPLNTLITEGIMSLADEADAETA